MEISGNHEPFDVRELLSPAPLVHQRGIEHILARVGMHPASAARQVHLRPHVVRHIQHPSCVEAHRAAAKCEAVCKFAAPTAARAQEHRRHIVARESGDVACGSTVQLDTACAPRALLRCRMAHSTMLRRSASRLACRLMTPGEEFKFEPGEEGAKLPLIGRTSDAALWHRRRVVRRAARAPHRAVVSALWPELRVVLRRSRGCAGRRGRRRWCRWCCWFGQRTVRRCAGALRWLEV